MEDVKIVSGKTEEELWPLIEADLLKEDLYNYHILIKQQNKEIELYIDIDLGGGFEGGIELTQLSAVISPADGFKFSMHDEGFIDEIGKFFGMQDVEIGYKELDKHLIIKTNGEEKVRRIFADADVQEVFASLEKFNCGIHTQRIDGSNEQVHVLELNIDVGINESAPLRKVYHAFYKLLVSIDNL